MDSVFLRDADFYHHSRPTPPPLLFQLILNQTGAENVNLVIDLGCGTGLSTFPWYGFSKKVVGVDPSREMLEVAKNVNEYTNISFIEAYSNNTKLEAEIADITTVASAIHWMEPLSTSFEVWRLLKPGGVFCYYGPYALPLTPFIELDLDYQKFKNEVEVFLKSRNEELVKYPDIDINNAFKLNGFIGERICYLHQEVVWNDRKYIDWIISRGQLIYWLARDDFEAKRTFIKLKDKVEKSFRGKEHQCIFTYKVTLFKKPIIPQPLN